MCVLTNERRSKMQMQVQMQMQMQVQVPSQPATPDQPTREKYRRSTNRKSQKKGSDPVRARPESLLNISSIFSFSCRSFFSSSLSLSSFLFSFSKNRVFGICAYMRVTRGWSARGLEGHVEGMLVRELAGLPCGLQCCLRERGRGSASRDSCLGASQQPSAGSS